MDFWKVLFTIAFALFIYGEIILFRAQKKFKNRSDGKYVIAKEDDAYVCYVVLENELLLRNAKTGDKLIFEVEKIS